MLYKERHLAKRSIIARELLSVNTFVHIVYFGQSLVVGIDFQAASQDTGPRLDCANVHFIFFLYLRLCT